MNNAALIACTRCAISKARCDRKVPCSQCVARGYVCQPRCTSRRPRAPRRPSGRNQSSTMSANVPGSDSTQNSTMDQFSAYTVHDNQPINNEIFVYASTTLPQGPLDLTGYEDFMNFPYSSLSGGEVMDGIASSNVFPNIPRLDLHSNGTHSSPQVGSGEMFKQQQELLHGPYQPPTPPVTSPRTIQSLPTSPPNGPNAFSFSQSAQEACMSNSEASGDVLGEMVDLLAQPGIWNGLPDSKVDAAAALSQDARDRIVATVQLLLHRALQIGAPPSASGAGLFGRIVTLPPSHVLMHFVELYAARIDSIQPYLGLAGSPTANIQDILQVDTADIGILLIILLITQGAMLTDHRESHVFAHGLIEICRVALNDVLERRSISQPMVGGIALQLLTLCARTGNDSFASYAMSRRGQYLSMLKCTGLLQPEQACHNRIPDGRDPWEKWKELEQRNRHAYAWVYVDLEISLLHDLPPVLSINDLQVPLPQDNDLWNAPSYRAWIETYSASASLTRSGQRDAQSYSAWLEHHGVTETQSGHEMPSLNSLFRSFLQGRLLGDNELPLHHLRLLLHPLQTMVLEQQQLLRIFDTDEPSNRYRVLSKTKVLGRLQETQDLVQDLATLIRRHSYVPMGDDAKIRTKPTDYVSIIMLHLVSLNVFTSIPEIEKCAKEEPPVSVTARTDVWRWARYPEGESYVLFHAGQIFRLIDSLSMDERPAWWPVAIYRASMACWSLRTAERPIPGSQSREVSIDTLLPSAEERFLNSPTGTPVVTFADKRRMPILEGGNSLQYCISKLEKHPTHLVSSVLEKVRFFLDRWSL